jgi:hypothetical protein
MLEFAKGVARGDRSIWRGAFSGCFTEKDLGGVFGNIMYKDSIWAKRIIALQQGNGAWWHFHTLSDPKNNPVTTEQALRRLLVLGFTMADAPVQKAVSYMADCLASVQQIPDGGLVSYGVERAPRKQQIPDRREKLHNWDIFVDLMLATWIRKFTKDNAEANQIAALWANVISAAFANGGYDPQKYEAAYSNTFKMKPLGDRLVDFVNFYQVSLIAGELDAKTEGAALDYILHKKSGIYYISTSPASLSVLPDDFTSRNASRYLAAIEILAGYRKNLNKLQFVVDWLERRRNENGKWDMGSGVNDKVYFPLSDSWRQKETRELDCTYRISKLLAALGGKP